MKRLQKTLDEIIDRAMLVEVCYANKGVHVTFEGVQVKRCGHCPGMYIAVVVEKMTMPECKSSAIVFSKMVSYCSVNGGGYRIYVK